jgi:putative acetyltransferase
MGQIREGTLADREAITRTHVASIRGVEGSVYDDEELAVWKSGAAATSYPLDDPDVVFFVAEREGEIAGFAEASIVEAELDKLYVAPAYQHRGIATSLSEAIDRRLRSRGVESVSVEASMNAVPFYERVGYERVGTHQKPVTLDGTTVEIGVVDMEKQLG